MWRTFIVGLLGLGVPLVASGAPIAYTDFASFSLAAGPGTVIDFDSLPSGTVLPSGSTVDGMTFNYTFAPGLSLAITDGTAFGGSGPFETTSAPNFLGTDDADLILDGDDFSLAFANSFAIGMFFISADSLLDDDIQLSAGGVTASLNSGSPHAMLPDGSGVFFLGIVDDAPTLTSADLDTIGGGFFLYNVDDILLVVPEPSTSLLLTIGAGWGFGLGSRRRRD